MKFFCQNQSETGKTKLLDQRGITGLETAIVLIAFVVVASVFAFAVLTTGLLSSEKSKEAIVGGLEETTATLQLRGSVVGESTSTLTHLDRVRFQVTTVSQGGTPVDLSTSGSGAAVEAYFDADNRVNLTTWTATWLSGTGSLLNPGETVEIMVPLTGLSPKLGLDKTFTVELKPTIGAVLKVERRTPTELTNVVDLN